MFTKHGASDIPQRNNRIIQKGRIGLLASRRKTAQSGVMVNGLGVGWLTCADERPWGGRVLPRCICIWTLDNGASVFVKWLSPKLEALESHLVSTPIVKDLWTTLASSINTSLPSFQTQTHSTDLQPGCGHGSSMFAPGSIYLGKDN